MEHVPSNFATYRTACGTPVFDAHFMATKVQGQRLLVAFTEAEKRDAAVAFQKGEGRACEALKAQEAFMEMRAGALAYLYLRGATDYLPLHLAAGPKGGWNPRVIEGGRSA